MVNVHMVVGSLVLLAYLVLTIVYLLGIGGRTISWTRPLSFAAAALLIIQYILGFSLLGSDHEITGWHYLIAIIAIIPVGLEHMITPQRANPAERSRAGAMFAGITFIIVLIAYVIGESS
jgi:heme A synthase